ncbi:MAG: XTP/dITP diphosphatase [Desulfobacteraceae bacterium]|nr:MAG: XTP/dITP diphosphatase [Desulfobacteraceae bacterium]
MQSLIHIVLATRNTGKTEEIRDFLKDFSVVIRNLNDFGPIPTIEEDGATFDENAYKKASLTARYLGIPALADDSGLMVEALGGAPGVHSARYGGQGASDALRCQKLLQTLGDNENRRAAFECVLSLAVPTGAALTFEGRCEGSIAHAPIGEKGFGYDPIFYYPPLNRTFAQLSMAEKSRVSHRGRALLELRSEMDKVLIWIGQHMPKNEPGGCMGGGTAC